MDPTPEDLKRRIEAALAADASGKKAQPQRNTAAAQAVRAATDLAAALFVGGFLGYWLDRWLGSAPLGMIFFLFIGFAAGFLNLYRSQTGQDFKIGFKRKTRE